jgi:hypothetical protein
VRHSGLAETDVEETVEALLEDRLTTAEFEEVVLRAWESGRFVLPGPKDLPRHILERAKRGRPDAYGKADDKVEFECRCLFGGPGRPGGFLLSGPGEALRTGRLADKNRPPHAHASGRIAVVAEGGAWFYAHRRVGDRDVVVEAPLSVGDVILWPPGTRHTFDAGDAPFHLFCAMGEFVSPTREHYPVDPPGGPIDLDALPRVRYDPVRGVC